MAYPTFDVSGLAASTDITMRQVTEFAQDIRRLELSSEKERERVDIRDDSLVVEVPEELL